MNRRLLWLILLIEAIIIGIVFFVQRHQSNQPSGLRSQHGSVAPAQSAPAPSNTVRLSSRL